MAELANAIALEAAYQRWLWAHETRDCVGHREYFAGLRGTYR